MTWQILLTVFLSTAGLCCWRSWRHCWCASDSSGPFPGKGIRKERPMAETAVLPPQRASSPQGRLFGLIPGLALLAAVGCAGKWIEQSIAHYGKAHHMVLPNIEYVLWAILLGLLIANTVGVPAIFRAGVASYEFWLKMGIVLLGARFLIGDVLRLGGLSLGLVLVEIALS